MRKNQIFGALTLMVLSAACATSDPAQKYQYNGPEVDANRAVLRGSATTRATNIEPQGVFGAPSDRIIAGSKQRIKGICLIRTQGTANADMACTGVTLVLTEVNGAVIAQSGTSTTGEFNFMAETAKQYLISPLSKKFEMDEDSKGPFDAGTKIVIHLRLK